MSSHTPDRVQWTLMIERLMDADLLLPEEGQTLLREIAVQSLRQESTVRPRAQTDQLTRALEAIAQTDSLDAVARQALLEEVKALIRSDYDGIGEVVL